MGNTRSLEILFLLQVFRIVRNRGVLAPHSTPDVLAPAAAAANGDLLLRAPSSAPAEVETAANGGPKNPKALGFSGLGLLTSPSFVTSSTLAAGGHEKLSKTRSDWFSSLFSPSKSRNNSSSTDTHR